MSDSRFITTIALASVVGLCSFVCFQYSMLAKTAIRQQQPQQPPTVKKQEQPQHTKGNIMRTEIDKCLSNVSKQAIQNYPYPFTRHEYLFRDDVKRINEIITTGVVELAEAGLVCVEITIIPAKCDEERSEWMQLKGMPPCTHCGESSQTQ